MTCYQDCLQFILPLSCNVRNKLPPLDCSCIYSCTVMVSVGVSALAWTNINFVELGVKVNGVLLYKNSWIFANIGVQVNIFRRLGSCPKKGTSIEARSAEGPRMGMGFLGGAVTPVSPPHQRGSVWGGERCKLPSGIWSGAPAETEFGAF